MVIQERVVAKRLPDRLVVLQGDAGEVLLHLFEIPVIETGLVSGFPQSPDDVTSIGKRVSWPGETSSKVRESVAASPWRVRLVGTDSGSASSRIGNRTEHGNRERVGHLPNCLRREEREPLARRAAYSTALHKRSAATTSAARAPGMGLGRMTVRLILGPTKATCWGDRMARGAALVLGRGRYVRKELGRLQPPAGRGPHQDPLSRLPAGCRAGEDPCRDQGAPAVPKACPTTCLRQLGSSRKYTPSCFHASAERPLSPISVGAVTDST